MGTRHKRNKKKYSVKRGGMNYIKSFFGSTNPDANPEAKAQAKPEAKPEHPTILESKVETKVSDVKGFVLAELNKITASMNEIKKKLDITEK